MAVLTDMSPPEGGCHAEKLDQPKRNPRVHGHMRVGTADEHKQ